MAATLSDIVLSASITTKLSDTVEGTSISAVGGKAFTFALTHGTGDGQASKVFHDEGRSLNSGVNESLDIYLLNNFQVSTDPLRNIITFAGIKGIIVYNRSTSAGNLLVGGNNTAAAWSQPFNSDDAAKLKLPPDSGVFLFSNRAGWSVTDATDHLLRIEASGGNCTYDIILLGI